MRPDVGSRSEADAAYWASLDAHDEPSRGIDEVDPNETFTDGGPTAFADFIDAVRRDQAAITARRERNKT